MPPVSRLDRAYMPPSAFCAQGKNEGVRCCTTERQNTHVTDRREVLYPWHPWSGQSVFVHDLIDKPGDAVFRCNLTGRRSDRLLEVPVWMFDRAACVACRRVDVAHVGLDTLTGLAEFVRDADFTTLDKSDSSSRAGAALDSEPTIRRSPNAAQNEDDATRAVPKHPVHDRGTNSALAEPARRDAANADTVALHRFAAGFGIGGIVFVALHIGTNILGWHKPDIVAHFRKATAPVMSARPCLHPDHVNRH